MFFFLRSALDVEAAEQRTRLLRARLAPDEPVVRDAAAEAQAELLAAVLARRSRARDELLAVALVGALTGAGRDGAVGTGSGRACGAGREGGGAGRASWGGACRRHGRRTRRSCRYRFGTSLRHWPRRSYGPGLLRRSLHGWTRRGRTISGRTNGAGRFSGVSDRGWTLRRGAEFSGICGRRSELGASGAGAGIVAEPAGSRERA